MMEKIKFKLTTPCNENWDLMSPKAQGRYCKLCAKTVIDFSKMNEEEILNWWKLKKESIEPCGRFSESQLDQKSNGEHSHLIPLFRKAAAIALVSFTVLQISTPAFSQGIIEHPVPPTYETIEIQKVKTPATFEVIQVPAEYDTITRVRMVKKAQIKVIEEPAEYITVQRKVLFRQGGFVSYREIDLVSPIIENPALLKPIHAKLKEEGFYNGEIDAPLSEETRKAVLQYRHAHKMEGIFEINQELLEKMNISSK